MGGAVPPAARARPQRIARWISWPVELLSCSLVARSLFFTLLCASLSHTHTLTLFLTPLTLCVFLSQAALLASLNEMLLDPALQVSGCHPLLPARLPFSGCVAATLTLHSCFWWRASRRTGALAGERRASRSVPRLIWHWSRAARGRGVRPLCSPLS